MDTNNDEGVVHYIGKCNGDVSDGSHNNGDCYLYEDDCCK